MNQSFSRTPSSQKKWPAQACGASIYTDPDDVASDSTLTTADKREVLASWISDARAVENAPSLRRLDSGAVVEVDAILRALGLLDERGYDLREDCKRLSPSGRRRSAASKWLKRVRPLGSNDNDDDPPPAPAGLGIPFRPKPLPPAHDARPQWVSELACATA
jgi:hypothetical protein